MNGPVREARIDGMFYAVLVSSDVLRFHEAVAQRYREGWRGAARIAHFHEVAGHRKIKILQNCRNRDHSGWLPWLRLWVHIHSQSGSLIFMSLSCNTALLPFHES
jgi:hypothetical protein